MRAARLKSLGEQLRVGLSSPDVVESTFFLQVEALMEGTPLESALEPMTKICRGLYGLGLQGGRSEGFGVQHGASGSRKAR